MKCLSRDLGLFKQCQRQLDKNSQRQWKPIKKDPLLPTRRNDVFKNLIFIKNQNIKELIKTFKGVRAWLEYSQYKDLPHLHLLICLYCCLPSSGLLAPNLQLFSSTIDICPLMTFFGYPLFFSIRSHHLSVVSLFLNSFHIFFSHLGLEAFVGFLFSLTFH